jgi:mycothiol synthase
VPAAVVTTTLDAARRAAIERFVTAREHELGYRPLSDQAWVELTQTSERSMVFTTIERDDGIHAYAQAAEEDGPGAWSIETAVDATAVDVDLTRQLLAGTISAVLAAQGTTATWLVQDATPDHETIAATFGLHPGRALYQMCRPLPTGLDVDLATRPFDPSTDIDTWVTVNARAFAWDPQQGSWTAEHVRARMAEPWFDPAGFLIHDRSDADGTVRMAGYCWTKVHPAEPASGTPALGEIYVIAVDPDFHGLGLGRQLTLAGLDSLARRGLETGMLFVDADNTAAVTLYEKLGFSVRRTDRQYHGALT